MLTPVRFGLMMAAGFIAVSAIVLLSQDFDDDSSGEARQTNSIRVNTQGLSRVEALGYRGALPSDISPAEYTASYPVVALVRFESFSQARWNEPNDGLVRPHPGDYIYTTAEVSVIEAFKGDLGSRATFGLRGGVRDGVFMDPDLVFETGDEAIVFVLPSGQRIDVAMIDNAYKIDDEGIAYSPLDERSMPASDLSADIRSVARESE